MITAAVLMSEPYSRRRAAVLLNGRASQCDVRLVEGCEGEACRARSR